MTTEKELYVLMDDDSPDDEIIHAIKKQFKTKPAPVLTDSYGDLSIYDKGLDTFMSDKAKEALYGDGDVEKKVKRTSKIKEVIFATMQAQPDKWFAATDLTAGVNGKIKSIQEVLRAALVAGDVVRKTHKVGNMNRGFLWKWKTQDGNLEDTLSEANPIVAIETVEVERTPEWTEPEVRDTDAFATPAQVPAAADLEPFLTRTGKDAVQAETAQETPLESPVAQVQEPVERVAPVSMEEQVEKDLKAIFADDYFAALVHRVVLDGPQNIGKKITVLKILAQLLSNTARGCVYAKELYETANYLSELDEVKNYYV